MFFIHRFFFTHDNVGDVAFCPSDLNLLRRRTFRDILCENSNVGSLPLSVFQIPSNTNPVVSCSRVVTMEAEELCLFGGGQKAKQLKNPGYVSNGATNKSECIQCLAKKLVFLPLYEVK